jgi:hypothetical protein
LFWTIKREEDDVITRFAFGLGFAAVVAAGTWEEGQAQRVSADIHIGGYPVAGTIHIGDRPYYRDRYYGYRDGYYGRPRRPLIIYPQRIAVERRHGWNWKKHRNAELVVVYFDRQCGLYFDRYRRGLEEVRVLWDDNRYYWYDDYDGRDERFRYDRRGDRRWDDRDRRWDDRYDRRRDRDWDRDRRRDHDDDDDRGRWEHDH